MSIDLTHLLVETASKVAITLNEYGDTIYGNTTSSACLYRDISTLSHVANRNEVSIDGQLWFAASEIVAKGDIYYHPSEGYLRIVKVIKAKRLLLDDSLQFIKCEVAKERQVS